MSASRNSAATLPHSWDIAHWPDSVYPNTPERARYVVRMHKLALLEAGALTRIGRELVIVGGPYGRWLQSKAVDVAHFNNGAVRSRSTISTENASASRGR